MRPSITVVELQRLPPAHSQLVDVRSPSEFAAGHIPGAVNIPMDQIEARIADIHFDVPLVLVCQSGTRARITAGLLEPCNFQMSVLEGGTSAWQHSGQPLVASVKTRWSLERQVRLGTGLLVVAGIVLALTVDRNWLAFSAFVGLGLTFAGLTDICPMGMALARMPWNSRRQCKVKSPDPSQSIPAQ